jgi:carbon storage regulator
LPECEEAGVNESLSRRRITMLVLSRKPGEKVRIGSDIILAVLEVRGNRVRIGLDAPAQFRIARQELYDPVGGHSFGERVQPEEMHHAAGNP